MHRRLRLIGFTFMFFIGLVPAIDANPIYSINDAALTGARLVDFDSLAGGSVSTINTDGVTITSATGSGAFYVTTNPTGDCVYTLDSSGGCVRNNNMTSILFTLDTAVSAFGLQIGATNVQWTLTALSASNAAIYSVLIPNQVSTMPYPYSGFYGVSSTDPIAAFLLSQTGGEFFSDILVFDNLHLVDIPENTPVTEPTTLALLGIGLGGVLLRSRSVTNSKRGT